MSIREAFFTVCEEAKPAESHFVSLYVRAPYYGGPEEGGWWGEDWHLVASQQYLTDDAAQAAKDRLDALAAELSAESRRGFGEQCLREMAWLESRGLDSDYLPEVDGEESYHVLIEETAGCNQSRGCREYP
jgi:hypothetical protein